MREIIGTFLTIMKGLLKYPVVFLFVMAMFVLNTIQEVTQTNGLLQVIHLTATIIVAAFCAFILIFDNNGKRTLNKIGFFSLLWFASCAILLDFDDFDFEMVIEILTSYEFILLGCLIPDFISNFEREQDERIKTLEERIRILEDHSHRSV